MTEAERKEIIEKRKVAVVNRPKHFTMPVRIVQKQSTQQRRIPITLPKVSILGDA